MKFRFRIIEELLDESAKTDFVDRFGEDRLNNFDKAKQRMKNKNLSVDYQSYLKMAPEELDDFITSLYDQKKDAQKVRILQGKDKEIRGKYNYLGRYGDYEVYEPLDYISSMDLGVNTGWCTTGRYGHAGHPEFTPSEVDARQHFDDYASMGVRLIYLLNPQTMYGEIAIAVYPRERTNKRVSEKDRIIWLKSTNFEVFDADDNNNYDLLNKIPQQIIDKYGLKMDYDIAVDISNPKEVEAKDVNGSTLLSIREAANLFPRAILAYSCNWWLRSLGYDSNRAADVSNDGYVDYGGYFVGIVNIGVRPAIILNPDSLNLESLNEGDIIEVFGKKWYYNSGKALLMDEPLTKMAFRGDWHAKDANNYKTSDVKAYLDNWFIEQKKKYSK